MSESKETVSLSRREMWDELQRVMPEAIPDIRRLGERMGISAVELDVHERDDVRWHWSRDAEAAADARQAAHHLAHQARD